jgi:3-hydroxyisobutyrate dehydrogenase-like beta-hydroxyacid dehydrogenase
MSPPSVGFCGLGTMGSGMVARLLGAGVAVTAWNRDPQRARALAPARPADTPAGTAADVVFLCVADDAAVREIAFGEHGVLGALARGAVLVDCGTTSLSLTAELDAAAQARGATFLDAPITGSKLGAENGTLTFMVGGPGTALERIAPLLAVMGKHTVHVGETAGLGQAAKYCLNLSQAVVLEGVLEGYVLAKKLGVPLPRMAEVFEHSAGRTGVGAFKIPYLLRGDFSPHFKLWLMHKDLHLALGEASRMRLALPLARSVCTLYDQGVAEGLGEQDFLALARLLERWAGIELREESAP